MASGKQSPRQKMINMMYLVLTALLAMNVSSEIMNAFKTIQNSISKTNSILDEKNQGVMDAFEEAKKDPQTAPKANIWAPKAAEITRLSNEMVKYLEDQKTALKKASDLKTVDGQEVYKEDDIDVSTRIMIEQNKGTEVYDRFKKYKDDVLNVLRNSNDLDPTIKEKVLSDVKSFEKNLPIFLDIPEPKKGGKSYSKDGKGWSKATFYMCPTLASVTIFTKMQNDVKNTQAQLNQYCFEQLGKVKFVYDKFAAVASANTTYCMPGDEIVVTAGVGAFNDKAKPTFVINGSNVPINSEGVAEWKTTASNDAGIKTIPVKISYTTPDGKVESKSIELKYTIGTPSGAAVMLDKMNVFYIGLDNPVTISSGTGDDKTSVTASGAGISLTKIAPSKYNVRVSSVGQASITVNADKKTTTFNFRVKKVPDPYITVGGKITTSRQNKAIMQVQQGLVAVLDNFDFEAKFQVLSYDYVYNPKGGDLMTGRSTDAKFPAQLSGWISGCKPKDVFSFENIKVKGPDGSTRQIPGLSVTIM